ncbi:MAG: UvrD-helicase domain-containing protein [Sphaerochaetaceae bacterium]|jgi:DNA helicase-2/ATP-dependent DNA helicase PcrA|nr:UvrD-helicase domain-containing protein [Sphaerochaetaceae bacterium]MDY0371923.1 UvrD-helicase domain-containing protein [Sphaerochaetaceae bacterium]
MPINLTGALNAEQSKAATTIHGPLLIIAGAGSGKTRVLCYRIAHLLQSNIKPENILALTFTNKAAQEMASRVRDLTKKSLVNLTTSTFHAFGMKVLKKHGHLLGYKSNFTIYDGADQASLLREVLFEEELDPQAYAIDTMLHLFSEIKTERKGWPSDTPQIAKTLYDAYRRHLRLYNAVDFDDLLMLPLDIFTRYPQVLDEYRSRFSHIMVDEFQDTSFEQYRLVKLLAQQSRNLCVVGDDDQSIYSWRGANYQNIILFEKDFPERIEIKLERNYRSTGTILDAANHLIVHNSQRKEKSLWTKSDSGKKIVMLHPQDDEEEIDLIISQMRKISFEQQLSWDNFGILVRTNHLIPAIENKLMLEHIPYNVSGGQSFFERKEVKDTLAYLRLLANPDDDVAFLRIVNTPRRKIGRTTLQFLRDVAEEHRCSLYSALSYCIAPDSNQGAKRVQPLRALYELIENYRQTIFRSGRKKSAVLKTLIEEIGYRQYLALTYPDNDQAVQWRYKSVETFLNLFARWEQDPENISQSLFDYLQRLSLSARDEGKDDAEEKKVSLMTMHASKGLEFAIVFLAGVEDHIVPHARAVEENPAALEEERRLFYVAITRARQLLYISNCAQRKRNRELIPSIPSRFLAEIPQILFEQPAEDYELDQHDALAAFAALKDRLAQKESS